MVNLKLKEIGEWASNINLNRCLGTSDDNIKKVIKGGNMTNKLKIETIGKDGKIYTSPVNCTKEEGVSKLGKKYTVYTLKLIMVEE